MADYCLTLTVSEGDSSPGSATLLAVPFLNYNAPLVTDGVSPVSVARYYPEGFEVPIYVDSNTDWTFYRWELRDTNSNLITSNENSSGLVPGFLVTMPSQNCTLTIFFSHASLSVVLSARVGGVENDVGGCIEIISSIPSGIGGLPCSGGSISVPYNSLLEISTIPKSGYEIDSRYVNNVSQSGTNSFSVSISQNTTIIVNYKELSITTCDTHHLSVSIEGPGSVSVSSGDYCEGDILSIVPIPSGNAKFVRWDYVVADLDISLSNITLNVVMNGDKNVKAIFSANPFVETFSPNVFYCPSQDYKSHLLSFEFENDTNDSGVFHFKASFYHDVDMADLFYSAFSFLNYSRWYYYDGVFVRPIPVGGLLMDAGNSYRIFYDPEVMPQNLTEQQREYTVNITNESTEIPLSCGVQYYVSIDGYNLTNDSLFLIKETSITPDCNAADGFYWSDDKDRNKWISSGQGQDDLKVSDSSDYSINSSVSSGRFDQFEIVWQGNRKSSNAIYGAIWDSKKDVLYSSGQGFFDKKYISNGINPIVISDPASNFYVTSNTKEGIGFDVCPPPIAEYFPGQETEDEVFEALCRPGENTYLGSSFGDMAIRVRKEDIDGSLVVNKDKALPIVSKQNIILDISGIEGAYAIRIRNSEDVEWGEWKIIDEESNNILKIDNQRFTVPWSLGRTNGIRRVCCRILTLYGITKTICTELFLNKNPIDYMFKFYKDQNRETPSDLYNGMSILTGSESGITVYFSVIFSEEVSYTDLKFNIIQQGINEVWGRPLSKINNTRFDGEFIVYKHDGVFNKDGKAFVQIVFPDSISGYGCSSDKTDIYNLIVNEEDAAKYQNLSPEEVFHQASTDRIQKIEEIESFRQYYDKDDENFLFGSPNYYKDK